MIVGGHRGEGIFVVSALFLDGAVVAGGPFKDRYGWCSNDVGVSNTHACGVSGNGYSSD